MISPQETCWSQKGVNISELELSITSQSKRGSRIEIKMEKNEIKNKNNQNIKKK